MKYISDKTPCSIQLLRRALVAAVVGCYVLAAQADPVFELVTHPKNIHGVEKFAAGEYAAGIKRLKQRLGSKRQAYTQRVPVLIDLCAGYTMLEDFSSASAACDAAVESGWYSSLALNNRGVLSIAKGNYEAAIRDFERAVESKGAKRTARRNLERAQNRLAAIKAGRLDTFLTEATER